MDLEVIHTVFTFGKFAALTPSSTNNHNPHCLQKLYEICVYLLYVMGFSASIYAHYRCANICRIHVSQFVRFESVLLCLLRFDRVDETEEASLVPTDQESRCCPVCDEENSTQVNLRSITTGLLVFDYFRSLHHHRPRRAYCSRIRHGRVLPILRYAINKKKLSNLFRKIRCF
jgi:hypothetical protein